MKLLIIQPTTTFKDGTPHKTRKRWVMGLTLPYLAGLAPPWVDVKLQDERYSEIDYDAGHDLVAITTTIATAARAYAISDEFRRRGIPVVMGGFHASLQPDECLPHCDAVVIGEAEYAWPELLEDFRAGRMKQRYQADQFHDLKGLPSPRWDLLDRKKYLAPFLPVMTTRGCPFQCSFCEVPVVYGTCYRHRPIGEVIEDMRRIPTRKIQIVDDNIAGSRAYAKELFRAMIPLKVRWSCLWTINTSSDTELLDLAVRAGVSHVNIGIESVSQSSLSAVNKNHNPVREYVGMLRELEKRRIFYSLNFMFGLDEDMPDIFTQTLDFLKRVNVPMVFFNTVTPREGTPMRSRLIEEGRIRNPMGDRYLGMECLFTPKHMTADEVEEGVWRCFREFYALPRIVRRFLLPPNSYFGQGFPSNLIFWWAARQRRDPVDFY